MFLHVSCLFSRAHLVHMETPVRLDLLESRYSQYFYLLNLLYTCIYWLFSLAVLTAHSMIPAFGSKMIPARGPELSPPHWFTYLTRTRQPCLLTLFYRIIQNNMVTCSLVTASSRTIHTSNGNQSVVHNKSQQTYSSENYSVQQV